MVRIWPKSSAQQASSQRAIGLPDVGDPGPFEVGQASMSRWKPSDEAAAYQEQRVNG
jgi:hypothetical protein